MVAGNWKDGAYDLYIQIAKEYTYDDITAIVPRKTFYSIMGRLTNIYKYITADFSESKMIYEQEYKHSLLCGHPDVVIGDHSAVYDVKTVTKFDGLNTKRQAVLQISAYIALARASGHNPDFAGIILPYQQQTLVYDLRYAEYDHLPLLNYLIEQARPRIYTMEQKLQYFQYQHLIGSHTNKVKGKIYDSLINFYSTYPGTAPCQLFLRGNRGAKTVKITDTDISQTLEYVFNYNIKFYVHASYAINLCHPRGIKTKNRDDVPWATNILSEDLLYTSNAGGRGVVVHTGKAMHLTEEQGYAEMHNGVLTVLDAATEKCPLLIETPCDKGTELCGTPESLASFYNGFTMEQQKKIKICIDTCHVFAAGYLPYDYLTKFAELVGGPQPIALIHLNDAQWAKGSCHDGHQSPGMGCIGLAEMLKAVQWCAQHGIPMVHE
jgi:deoxyribonuclease-4